VYCGQTVGRIKMKLGMQVGLGPGHIELDKAQLTPSAKKGHSPQFSAYVYCGQWSPISATAELLFLMISDVMTG